VELLIVMAIVAIIAAIVVPSMLTSKWAANETGAIQGCRTLGSAESAYAAVNGGQFASLETLVSGGFLDSRYSKVFNGYAYGPGPVAGALGASTPPAGYGFTAAPVGFGGRHTFGIGTDQIVRYLATIQGAEVPSGMNPGDPITREATASPASGTRTP
jgi:competence protein ComGC